MDLTEIRREFSIYIFDHNNDRGLKVFENLREVGYVPKIIKSKQDFFDSAKIQPPHVVLYFFEGDLIDDEHLQNSFNLLPETHFIFLATDLTLLSAVDYLDKGVYDCIEYPLMTDHVLTRAVDRAIERDFFCYQNEQIKEKVKAGLIFQEDTLVSGKGTKLNEIDLTWIYRLQQKKSLSEVIFEYQKHLSNKNFETEVLFFKYVEPHKTFVCVSSVHSNLDINQPVMVESVNDLKVILQGPFLESEKMSQVIKESFSVKQFNLIKLEYQSTLFGVFAVFTDQLPRRQSFLEELKLQLVSQQCWNLTLMLQMQKLILKDELTGFYKFEHFLNLVNVEMSRARRISSPVSVIYYRFSNHGEMLEKYGSNQVNLFIRKFSSLILKSSRVSDIVGTLSENEFAVICPHTSMEGAVIKASRMPELLNQQGVLKDFEFVNDVVFSRSVVEYPSHCHNGAELLDISRELINKSNQDNHKTVIVPEMSETFKPDF